MAVPASLLPLAVPIEVAMPVNSRPAMSGRMVIFSAVSHRLPMGSARLSAVGAAALPDSSAPAARPSSSAMKMRTAIFTRR